MLPRNIILATTALFAVLATGAVNGAAVVQENALLRPDMANAMEGPLIYRRHHLDQDNVDDHDNNNSDGTGHHGHKHRHHGHHHGSHKDGGKTPKKDSPTGGPGKKDPSIEKQPPTDATVTGDDGPSTTTDSPGASVTDTAGSGEASGTMTVTSGDATVSPTEAATGILGEPTMTSAGTAVITITSAVTVTNSVSVPTLAPTTSALPHAATPFPPSNNGGISNKMQGQAMLGLLSLAATALLL